VLILLVYVVLPKTRKIGQWTQIKDIDYLSIGILALTILLTLNQLNYCLNNLSLISYNGWLKVDSMVCLIKLICLSGGLLVI